MARSRRTDLRLSLADGAGFSVMVGMGENYVAAFALAIGLSETHAGWLVSLPLIAGALLQIVSPFAVRRLGSNKRWVILCAGLQASAVFVYAIGAMVGEMPIALLFASAALYWASGYAGGPAWTTWIGTVVPHALRARFFATRALVSQIAVVTALAIGGVSIYLGREKGVLLPTFAAIFVVAGLARTASMFFVASISEPRQVARPRESHLLATWIRLRREDGGRVLRYMVWFWASVMIAGPFFIPYVLEQLHWSYLHMLALLAISYGTKMSVLPLLGHYAKRAGAKPLLFAAGIGIVPLPIMWTVSDAFAWILMIQAISGVIWACYELGTQLLLFEHIDERERTTVLTGFNVGHALSTVVGALIGGLVLERFGVTKHSYHVIFCLSSAGCAFSLLFLIGLHGTKGEDVSVSVDPLAIDPYRGSHDMGMVSDLSRDADASEAGPQEASEADPPAPA